jgi:hypothetical protein
MSFFHHLRDIELAQLPENNCKSTIIKSKIQNFILSLQYECRLPHYQYFNLYSL